MITITPVRRALVPVDSDAAARISAPNYDEFQGDREIWDVIQDNPLSVLRITMAHCSADSPETIGSGDSPAALAKAGVHMGELEASELTREVSDILWVYEIEDPSRPHVRQIGLGGMARTDEIRTDATPQGTIIRNEGVREPKARGRADLIQATHAIIGMVNNAVDDASGEFESQLIAHADTTPVDIEVTDQHGNRHRVWIVSDPPAIQRLQALLAAEPHAYVADGNHRSAAAAMLGKEHFLSVFFPARSMGIQPYNRLVRITRLPPDHLAAALAERFDVDTPTGTASPAGTDQPAEADSYQPAETHEIGLYTPDQGWLRLRPLPGTFDPDDAGDSIDHGIVQKNLFAKVFGIPDAGDDRLTFVGATKNAAWLRVEVDEGRATYAVTLPAVTMDEFVEVCRQNRLMPPKSTWFEPKVRSGLVMALLDA